MNVLTDDAILHIADICTIKTLISLSQTSRRYYNLLYELIGKKLSNVPWRISIEYSIKNNIKVHNIKMSIGYVNYSSEYDEVCDMCSMGRWKKQDNKYICVTRNDFYTSRHIKILVFYGIGLHFLDRLYEKHLEMYVFTHKGDDSDYSDYRDDIYIETDYTSNYIFYDEIKPTVYNLDPTNNDTNVDNNKIIKRIYTPTYRSKYNTLNSNYIVQYDGYINEYFEDYLK